MACLVPGIKQAIIAALSPLMTLLHRNQNEFWFRTFYAVGAQSTVTPASDHIHGVIFVRVAVIEARPVGLRVDISSHWWERSSRFVRAVGIKSRGRS